MQTMQTTQTMQAGVFRLSPQQSLLWELVRSGLTLPPVLCVADAEGPLDAGLLGRALRELVSRHEILRTRVATPAGDGTPRQVVGPAPVEPPLNVLDLSGLATGARDEACDSAWTAARRAAQDPASEAPIELTLLDLGGERRRLLLRFSPFCADRAGALNFLRELARAYDDTAAGRAREDGELQYADVSEWQHELLESEEAKAGRERWKGGGVAAVADAPHAVASRATEAALLQFDVEEPLAREVGALAEAAGVSEAALLLTCWQVLVARHGEESVNAVGVLEDNRGSDELAGVIGPLLRTLPVSPGFGEADGFAQAARTTERALAEARRWQEYFSPSDGARPGFCFEFEPAREELRAGQSVLTIQELSGRPPTFAALLSCAPRGGALACGLHYDAALINGEAAAAFASRFVALLRRVVTTPGAAIRRLDVTGEEERGRLLAPPWGVEGVQTVEECIHQIFERRAREHPGRDALTFEGRHMTYGELDARADALARRLKGAGVGPESRVGVFAEPSHELVVALLAVLKAGAAYVPIDPSTPARRVAAMLEDSRASALVCQRALAALLPEGHAPTHIIDAEAAADDDDAREARHVPAALPDNLAYVIYTSGSTGKPKGVQVTHANVVRLLKSTEEWFGFGERDVWTMFHSHAFDFSVWEMWGALLTGGRLVLVPQHVKTSPADLRELLRRERVTILNQTPSVFRLLSRADAEADSSEPLSLRLVVFGGEALDPQSLGSWFDRYGDERPRLVNMYGITETTVHVTYRVMRRGDLDGRPQSPVGVPIRDLSAYVLDRHMNLAPRGAAGELYVGGTGVARGYLGRPDLTAERFVPDPFSREPGARLYKSGDGVRMLAGDDLEYLGRIDQQVKIRGFRIELGEIEAAMRGHEGVRDAAVVCVEEGGEKRLVGFYAAASGGVAGDGLRGFLSASLPTYMVPSRFARLEALPVNVNGKTDRKALVGLALAGERSGEFVAPRTPTEARVAEVWARLLGHERVGVEDHFFDLGGHSLLATQIAHELREACQVDVPLAWFFDGAPTVAGLAALVEARQIQSAEEAELAAALAEIDALSDEEVSALLAGDERAGAHGAAPLEQV